jgi:small-conductance mechanosensitive channel
MATLKKWGSLGLGFILCFLLTVNFGHFLPVQGQNLSLIEEVIGTPSQTQSKTPTAEVTTEPSEFPDAFPVTLDGNVLWQISAPVADISPQNRAQGQIKRIKNLADDFSMKPEDIKIVKDKSSPTTYVRTKEFFLLSITPEDAKIAGVPQQVLAEKYRTILLDAIAEYQKQRSGSNVFRSLGWMLLATLSLGVLLYLINRFFALILIPLTQFDSLIGQRVRGLSFGGKTKALIIQSIRFLINFLKLFSYLSLIFFYVTFILYIYPFSNDYSLKFKEFIETNVHQILSAFLGYLPNLFMIGLIVIITYYIVRVNHIIFSEIKEGGIRIPGFYDDWAEPTGRLTTVLILIMGVMIASPYLPGFDSPAAKGITLFIGVLFSLGSSGAIANIVSGILLIYTRAFRVGDFVEIEGVRGIVVENTLLVTRIKTYLNEIVSIPNSKVLTSTVTNLTIGIDEKNPGVIIKTTITLGYDNSWRKIYETLSQAALRTSDILKEPAPFVLQTELSDFYVAYTLHAYVNNTNTLMLTYSELHQNIQDCCNEVGIEIMSSHFTTLRDGNHTTIPEKYLESDYQAPGFRVEGIK